MNPRRSPSSAGRSLRPLVGIIALAFIGWLVWLGREAPEERKNPRAADVATSAGPVIEAIRTYRSSHDGRVPETQEVLIDFMSPAGGALPSDPWGHALVYVPRDPKFQITYVKSLGADGREHGSDENADVSVWVCDAPE